MNPLSFMTKTSLLSFFHPQWMTILVHKSFMTATAGFHLVTVSFFTAASYYFTHC